MAKAGVRRREPGETRDEAKARKEYQDKVLNRVTDGVKDETMRRLYFAKNYGYAPEER